MPDAQLFGDEEMIWVRSLSAAPALTLASVFCKAGGKYKGSNDGAKKGI
jgi:hypothetical protein